MPSEPLFPAASRAFWSPEEIRAIVARPCWSCLVFASCERGGAAAHMSKNICCNRLIPAMLPSFDLGFNWVGINVSQSGELMPTPLSEHDCHDRAVC